MIVERFMLAAGHDNDDILQQLHTVSPPLFNAYRRQGIPQTWQEPERIMNGARRFVVLDTPVATVHFKFLTDDEYGLLVDTYCTNGIDGLVTVELENRTLREWHIYNATMVLPQEAKHDHGGWDDVDVVFQDLTEIV